MQEKLLRYIRDFYYSEPYKKNPSEFTANILRMIDECPALIINPDDMYSANAGIENRGNDIIYNIPSDGNYSYQFDSFLERSGFDSYGDVADDRLQKINQANYGFENDTFIIRPHYCGNDNRLFNLPNFVYKPDDVVIVWQKYPLCNARSNKLMSTGDFATILAECEASLDDVFNGKLRMVERPETYKEIAGYQEYLSDYLSGNA